MLLFQSYETRSASGWKARVTLRCRNFKDAEKTIKKNSKNMPYGINYEQILNSLVVKPVRAVLLFNFAFFENFVPMCLCISVTILKSCGALAA